MGALHRTLGRLEAFAETRIGTGPAILLLRPSDRLFEPTTMSASASAESRVRIGFSFAVVSLLTITCGALLMYNSLLGRKPHFMYGGLGLTGFLVWLAGQVRSSRPLSPDSALACVGTAKRWGVLVMISASLIYCLSEYRRLHAKVPVVAARELPKVNVVAPEVHFPPLRLQSIVFQGSRSTALINGKVVGIGEDVALVQVVAIQPDHVTVALQGKTKELSLGDAQ